MTTPDAVRSTVVDVDLDAIAANLSSIRDRAKADVIAVVKADAYGHGAEAVAETSFEAGAVMVAVATVEEGLALREAGVNGPILVFFGPTDSSEVAHAVAQDLVLTVWDHGRARAISEAGAALRRTARVHFKVDTGLTRLGAPAGEAVERLREIRALARIEVDGIFTHLATADDPDTSNDQVQLAKFREVLGAIRDRPRLVHAVASAGVAAFGPVEGLNAVRPGLAIYGVHAARHLATALPLRPALTWHSRIHRIASVPKGITPDETPVRGPAGRGPSGRRLRPAGDQAGRIDGAALHLHPLDSDSGRFGDPHVPRYDRRASGEAPPVCGRFHVDADRTGTGRPAREGIRAGAHDATGRGHRHSARFLDVRLRREEERQDHGDPPLDDRSRQVVGGERRDRRPERPPRDSDELREQDPADRPSPLRRGVVARDRRRPAHQPRLRAAARLGRGLLQRVRRGAGLGERVLRGAGDDLHQHALSAPGLAAARFDHRA